MKRFLATALTLSMVLMLMGCSKEETTKKKKKKAKKTTTTEESTEDTTEEPTESETSEEPTETSMGPAAGDFTIDHSLESLGIYNVPAYKSYAAGSEEYDFFHMNAVRYYYDYYYSDFDGYDDLLNTVSGVFEYYDNIISQGYQTGLSLFIENYKNTGSADRGEYAINVEPFRADSQIYSFAVEESFQYAEYDESNYYGFVSYNFRSQDGSCIDFNDVVLNTDAFCSYVDEYLRSLPTNYKCPFSVAEIEAGIKDGTIPFGLSFDGIYLFYNCDFFKVPVYPISGSGCVDMSYFGSTTKYYAIELADTRSMDWDVTGDGVIDHLAVNVNLDPTDEYGETIESLGLEVNGTETTIPASDMDLFGFYEGGYYMQCDDGAYLFLSFSEYDENMSNYIFVQQGDSFTYVGTFYGYFFKTVFNPDYFELRDYVDIVGTTEYIYDLTMTGCEGMPEFISKYIYSYRCWVCAAKDFKAMRSNVDDSYTEVTIPANTPIAIRGYNIEEDCIFFETLHEDDAENEYFEYPVGDTDFDEIFKGIVYAG